MSCNQLLSGSADEIVNTPTSQDPSWMKLKFVNLKNMRSLKDLSRYYNKQSGISHRSWSVWGITRNYWLGSRHLIGMLIWYWRMWRRYVWSMIDWGECWSVSFLVYLDTCTRNLSCSTIALNTVSPLIHIDHPNRVSRSEWSPSVCMILLNDPQFDPCPNYHAARDPTTRHCPIIYLAPSSLNRHASLSNLVLKTDVGRNTKRKRKETSQQRSIYLVCLFLSSFLFVPSPRSDSILLRDNSWDPIINVEI